MSLGEVRCIIHTHRPHKHTFVQMHKIAIKLRTREGKKNKEENAYTFIIISILLKGLDIFVLCSLRKDPLGEGGF